MTERRHVLYRPQLRVDLLRAPLLGRFLRWRWGRLALQLLLLALAALALYDGFSGPPIAPTNIAGVVVWVHYRGFVVFSLLLAGNLFCMSCPFTIPRTLARRFGSGQRRWPRRLRNKWVAIAVLVLYFWFYEWLDLWASPSLTAWVIAGYFVASFVLEAAFAESPFCKYVCPLGTFNFAASTISPLQITVRDADVCRTCEGKECINGSPQVSGCGTELFPPQVKSNMDCVFCLDCARACPYDNVALAARSPLREVSDPRAWPRRWDLNMLVFIFAFIALSNAFGMVPPMQVLERRLMVLLHTQNEGLILFLIFVLLNLLLPVALALGAASLSRRLAQREEPLRHTFARYAPAFAPLAFAVWLAHYGGSHFLGSALNLIPVLQNFMLDHHVTLFGTPDWSLGPLLPSTWIDPLELLVVLTGFGAALYVGAQRARHAGSAPDAPAAQLPWFFLLLLLAISAMFIFLLPMEMRGMM
jgi:polyferredoxin